MIFRHVHGIPSRRMRSLFDTLGGIGHLIGLAVKSGFRMRSPYWRWRAETPGRSVATAWQTLSVAPPPPGEHGVLRVSDEGYYELNLSFGDRVHRVLMPISDTVVIQQEPEVAVAEQIDVERFDSPAG